MPRGYIRGEYAKASCALIDTLKKQGIVATVGYATDPKKRGRELSAYVSAENAFRVPREWQGFTVTVHVDNELASASSGTATS
jgi:hypothetical protein